MATTPVESMQDADAGFINQIQTSHRPQQAEQTINRLLRKPSAWQADLHPSVHWQEVSVGHPHWRWKQHPQRWMPMSLGRG